MKKLMLVSSLFLVSFSHHVCAGRVFERLIFTAYVALMPEALQQAGFFKDKVVLPWHIFPVMSEKISKHPDVAPQFALYQYWVEKYPVIASSAYVGLRAYAMRKMMQEQSEKK